MTDYRSLEAPDFSRVRVHIVDFDEMDKAPVYIPSLFKEKPKSDFRPDAGEARHHETLRSKIKKTINEWL